MVFGTRDREATARAVREARAAEGGVVAADGDELVDAALVKRVEHPVEVGIARVGSPARCRRVGSHPEGSGRRR